MSTRSMITVGAFALMALANNAAIAQVPATNVWLPFEFGLVGSNWSVEGNLGTAITFAGTLTQDSYFNIVDLGTAGDRFAVSNNGAAAQFTSLPSVVDLTTAPSYYFGEEIDALLDPSMSRGSFLLQAGAVSITVTTALSPLDGGIASFQIVPVPEPSQWVALMAGLALIGAIARRRSSR